MHVGRSRVKLVAIALIVTQNDNVLPQTTEMNTDAAPTASEVNISSPKWIELDLGNKKYTPVIDYLQNSDGK